MTSDTPPHGDEVDPDFTALYELDYTRGAPMTPRMAYWLWDVCIYLADTWRDSRGDPAVLLDQLPPLARPLARGEWFDRFTDCFEALAQKIASGEGDQERLAASTGEEMALHMVVDLAEAFVADGMLGPAVGRAASLPDHGDADIDFDTMREMLFADNDVLILFDPSMDGAEIEGGELDRVQRFANLHPKDWFKPFAES